MIWSVNSLRGKPASELVEIFSRMTAEERLQFKYSWRLWARPDQILPAPNANSRTVDGAWVYWLAKAGRGWGKTRVGAEAVREWVKVAPLVNLVGATADDARDIMIEGESGILRICPRWERPIYKKSERKLLWPNGAVSLIFTADEPDRARGKQHMKVWADEIAAWRYAETWDQIKLGLRLGSNPQAVVTSTPRPNQVIRDLIKDPNCIVTNGRTVDNFQNLAKSFIQTIIKKYEGTRLGRQELDGEVLDDNPNALFNRKDIDKHRITAQDFAKVELQRVAIGVDPSVSAKEDSDLAGIICAGRARGIDGRLHAFITDDESLIAKPRGWAQKAVSLYHRRGADRLVAEVNNGGDLVEETIRAVDENVSYRSVHATRGKIIRAEPISAMYEQGRIHHVGSFAKLEDEMCDYDPLTASKSPDRMDALVWVLWDLMIGPKGMNLDAMADLS